MEDLARLSLSKSLASDRHTDPEFYAGCAIFNHESLSIDKSRHAELWALLHFIMPSLFDSHDEFNEWFSKDIENAAENKGSKLNEHQLRRLHMILRPFMLRRVKRNVQNELSDKVLCLFFFSQKMRDHNAHVCQRSRKTFTLISVRVSVQCTRHCKRMSLSPTYSRKLRISAMPTQQDPS